MIRSEMLRLILIEELAEVQQALSKCLRFTEHNSYEEISNSDRVRNEMIDVFTLLFMIQRNDGTNFIPDFDNPEVEFKVKKKVDRVEHYLSFSKEKGSLNENNSTH